MKKQHIKRGDLVRVWDELEYKLKLKINPYTIEDEDPQQPVCIGVVVKTSSISIHVYSKNVVSNFKKRYYRIERLS